jgi:hypothetical protein
LPPGFYDVLTDYFYNELDDRLREEYPVTAEDGMLVPTYCSTEFSENVLCYVFYEEIYSLLDDYASTHIDYDHMPVPCRRIALFEILEEYLNQYAEIDQTVTD